MPTRALITLFSANNPIYAFATIHAYEADANGDKTATLATLYDAITGGSTVTNPFALNQLGRVAAPIYSDTDIILEIHGVGIAAHSTGVLTRNYPVSGTTAARPTLTSDDIGFLYFDTTIGRPIWWDGGEWVDALGLA